MKRGIDTPALEKGIVAFNETTPIIVESELLKLFMEAYMEEWATLANNPFRNFLSMDAGFSAVKAKTGICFVDDDLVGFQAMVQTYMNKIGHMV